MQATLPARLEKASREEILSEYIRPNFEMCDRLRGQPVNKVDQQWRDYGHNPADAVVAFRTNITEYDNTKRRRSANGLDPKHEVAAAVGALLVAGESGNVVAKAGWDEVEPQVNEKGPGGMTLGASLIHLLATPASLEADKGGREGGTMLSLYLAASAFDKNTIWSKPVSASVVDRTRSAVNVVRRVAGREARPGRPGVGKDGLSYDLNSLDELAKRYVQGYLGQKGLRYDSRYSLDETALTATYGMILNRGGALNEYSRHSGDSFARQQIEDYLSSCVDLAIQSGNKPRLPKHEDIIRAIRTNTGAMATELTILFNAGNALFYARNRPIHGRVGLRARMSAATNTAPTVVRAPQGTLRSDLTAIQNRLRAGEGVPAKPKGEKKAAPSARKAAHEAEPALQAHAGVLEMHRLNFRDLIGAVSIEDHLAAVPRGAEHRNGYPWDRLLSALLFRHSAVFATDREQRYLARNYDMLHRRAWGQHVGNHVLTTMTETPNRIDHDIFTSVTAVHRWLDEMIHGNRMVDGRDSAEMTANLEKYRRAEAQYRAAITAYLSQRYDLNREVAPTRTMFNVLSELTSFDLSEVYKHRVRPRVAQSFWQRIVTFITPDDDASVGRTFYERVRQPHHIDPHIIQEVRGQLPQRARTLFDYLEASFSKQWK